MKLFFIILFSTCLFASSAHAAVLSMDVQQPIQVGGKITVAVLVDTAGESINSADISVRFPTNLLTFSGYADSAIPLWIERPHVQTAGEIHFSGIIPGGLERAYDPAHPQDPTSTLVRLFFTVQASGSGELAIAQPQLLKNDGLGTSIPVTTVPLAIATNGTAGHVSGDTVPPEAFTISIVDRSFFGRTPRLAIFSTDDAQSGIDHYEARIQQGKWFTVTSPYALPFRLFSYTLTVRAFDFAGNYKEQNISVPGEQPQQVVILGLLIVCILLFLIYKNRNKMSI